MIKFARVGRRVATGAAALVVAGGMATAAKPAEAAGWTCSAWQHKEFATSGFNTDVDIRFCIKRYTHLHTGHAEVKWRDGGGVKKFDNFDVKVRLERYDKDYDHATCSLESSINLHESKSGECVSVYHDVESNSKKKGGWSVDGYVAYDYDADGEGGKTWSLKGTPLIK